MVKLLLNTSDSIETTARSYEDLINHVMDMGKLTLESFYLEQNGKRLECDPSGDAPVYVRLRILGGKGGFGSMLRAIGAQIEKTTNREACRDLSGRRLRDINEEKRLKAWLEKQGEREREAEERKKRKIEKLLAVPKHEFKDEEYEESRSKLTEKVCDAVEEGFKKASKGGAETLKRKQEPSTSQKPHSKPKKAALWIDDDLSDDSDDSDNSDDDGIEDKAKKPAPKVSAKEQNISETDKQLPTTEETSSSDSEAVSVVSK